jgi:hypothetical protein
VVDSMMESLYWMGMAQPAKGTILPAATQLDVRMGSLRLVGWHDWGGRPHLHAPHGSHTAWSSVGSRRLRTRVPAADSAAGRPACWQHSCCPAQTEQGVELHASWCLLQTTQTPR